MSDLPKAESLYWHKIDAVLPPEDGVYWIRLWRDGSIYETRAGYDRTMEQFFLYGSFLTEVISWAHYPLEADGLDASGEFSGRNAIVAELRHEIRDTQGVATANIQRAEAAEANTAELIRANNELARLNVDLQVQVADLEAKFASDEADENAWLDAYAESSARDGATIKRLLARAAELEAQLAAMQTAACPHCGKSLAGENLAPF